MKYWKNEGKYETEAKELNELMPSMGMADTLKGEIWRAACKIYYDYFNNGFGNYWKNPAMFLIDNVELPESIKQIFFRHAEGNFADGANYDEELDIMIDTVVEALRGVDDQPNSQDMWEYSNYRLEGEFDEEYQEEEEDFSYDDEEDYV